MTIKLTIGHWSEKERVEAEVEKDVLLMDLANKFDGIVVGSGNLSELALGWATYNGDHMSMYAVNSGVPKTLVRRIVQYVADTTENAALRAVLTDILHTPVSPELIPPKGSEIIQRTEDIVGPYELHDFFIYHTLRWGREPKQILDLAKIAFDGKYHENEIRRRYETFRQRFYSQQFKRSCLPDGPKVGSVSLSPRGGLFMPSDAVPVTFGGRSEIF